MHSKEELKIASPKDPFGCQGQQSWRNTLISQHLPFGEVAHGFSIQRLTCQYAFICLTFLEKKNINPEEEKGSAETICLASWEGIKRTVHLFSDRIFQAQ